MVGRVLLGAMRRQVQAGGPEREVGRPCVIIGSIHIPFNEQVCKAAFVPLRQG